ncbi:MAG: DUF2911 domain-containing protein, partial [Chitinophagaceae bacterium]|nr:DUF2911 domain-containing protein [Chitinophagaceae bacterium]
MIKLILLAFVISTISAAQAQNTGPRFPDLDKSPMDMAYFPNGYPVAKIQGKATEPV